MNKIQERAFNLKESGTIHIRSCVKSCGRILDKHTDIISSVGILAISTSLLVSQIFQKIPRILPRIAKVVYDFGGIIWLNVQVRDFVKSGKDFYRAIFNKEASAILKTAVKVFFKGVNILLTCAFFSGSLIAAFGFPQVSLLLSLKFRPLGLFSLGANILSDISDYSINEKVICHFSKFETDHSEKIVEFIESFKTIISSNKTSSNCLETKQFTDLVVRQLDTQTVETFRELFHKKTHKDSEEKIFHSIKEGIVVRQSGTKANLSLIALGYISMGICRAFPHTLIDLFTRWTMSVLYTDELIKYKLFQYDLQNSRL